MAIPMVGMAKSAHSCSIGIRRRRTFCVLSTIGMLQILLVLLLVAFIGTVSLIHLLNFLEQCTNGRLALWIGIVPMTG
ncbi:hypothetical protein PBN151_4384 [Paenibacillus sp. NAIST15-1]|nr:hypothetical protein PBN151_4384 [Paenibacillus sp. NAIST15-1]